jgi:allantoinase
MKLIKNACILKDDQMKTVNITYDSNIQKISTSEISGNFETILDVKNAILIPGGIDAHVHFNDPGFEHHEDFETGTKAAAAGGITTIIDMPCTSIPPVTNKANLSVKLAVIAPKAHVDYALWGGISGREINHRQISELWENGVVGFKVYTVSGMNSFTALSYQQIGGIFKALPDYLYAFHAEDKEIIEYNLKNSKITAKNYAFIRSIEAEFKAVKEILEKSNSQNHLHFVHISSRKAAELILHYKNKISVSWETCPHYLQFTAADFPVLRGKLKTAPPVKFEEDRFFLREQLKNLKLDFVSTDHAGCDFGSEKNIQDFSQIYNGIPGTQFMIPYLFSEFFNKEKLLLSALIKMTSESAAKRYGLYPQKGSLNIGSDADFTVINCNDSYQIDENELLCKGKYSPFHGNLFTASVVYTILRGEIIYEKGIGMTKSVGSGRWVKRKE